MTETALPDAAAGPALARLAGKRACVIGGGFGGLALAIRLQTAGCATTLVEARPQVGGWAAPLERDGFLFDSGPAALARPALLQSLWEAAGEDIGRDIELLPLSPACRFHWPDGTHFDLSGDDQALQAEVARLSPIDLGGVGDFLRHCARAARADQSQASAPDWRPRRLWPALRAQLGGQHWRSAYGLAARLIESEKLRQAFTVQLVLQGADPTAPGSARLLAQPPADLYELWFPRGGMGTLAAAMLRLFERLGGETRLHDPVVRLHTLGNRVSEVETQSGWRARFDAVASNADVLHTYRDLLGQTTRGAAMARQIATRRHAPAMFTVHFALEGAWPGIPHRMVLFGQRYNALLKDIFEHGVLPQDMLIFLSHPSVTDPSLVPEGRSLFQASIPVAHLGRLAVDWDQVGPLLEKRILAEIGRRLIPGLTDRIITVGHRTPRDHALELSAHLGSAFGMAPLASQTDLRRPALKDRQLANFYLVGAGTFPGAGLPNVLTSAGLAAGLMEKDLIG